MFKESAKRDTILNCHISSENKEWLVVMSEKLNRPIGDITDECISEIRRQQSEKKKESKK